MKPPGSGLAISLRALRAGSHEAIGWLQTVFGGIPIAGPVVRLVGLVGDLAAIETGRDELNDQFRELGPICLQQGS